MNHPNLHEMLGEHATPRLYDVPALIEFATVARWEHITRAAQELGIPQSTLSRRLRRLEGSLGVRLLERRGRGVVLTRQGRRMAALLESTLSELERGVADVATSVDADRGVVTLAFLSTMGVAVVPHLLHDYRRRHPRVTIQLVQDGQEAGLRRLRDGEVDICLTAPLPREPDLSVVPLHREQLVLTVPEGHPAAGAIHAELRDFRAQPFIGFKHGYGMRSLTEDCCREAGFLPRLSFEGEDPATVRGLVAAGLGVALLPSAAAPMAGTAELELLDVQAFRTIGLAHFRGRELPPAARAFRAFLVDHASTLMTEPKQTMM